MMTMVIIGIVCGLVLVIMIGDIVFSEPVEDFDEDLSKGEQESEAQGVVDSMRGELDYMRRDGLL